MDSNQESDLLFFLHLSKSAGTTFNQILDKQYSEKGRFANAKAVRETLGSEWIKKSTAERELIAFQKLESLPSTDRAKLNIVKGHMTFGWHESFVNRNCSYLTFVREPIDRIVSQYYYIKRLGDHHLSVFIEGNNLSLRGFVDSRQSLVTDNGMTRKIAGLDDTVPYGSYSEDILEIAKNNIDKYFSFIGLSEYFDESILMMKTKYNWKTPYYIQQNVTKNRTATESLDMETIETIKTHNKLDIQLYDYIKEEFLILIENQGQPFQKRLKNFRRANKIYSTVYKNVKKGKSYLFK